MKQLLRIVAALGALAFVGFVLPNLGPGDPGSPQGIVVSATTPRPVTTDVTTPSPTLPPGFPSTFYPPPTVDVPEGDPIPINTKYGVSYTIPGNWRNYSDGVSGWNTDSGSVTYGAIGMYEYDYCPEHRGGATKAKTGMTGRTGVDVATAAFDASRQAETIYRDEPDDAVVFDYSDPVAFEIDGAPAVRYSVDVSNIAQKYDCDPTDVTFDIVATQGYSNATVALFLVETYQGIDGALPRNDVDQIISTLRRGQ